MGKIWLTSDTHFGHDRAFIYEPRGFNTTWGHDKSIIENWNNLVDMDDDVYHLGDIMLGDNDYGLSCLKQLKGRIHIIRGNHDTDTRMGLYRTCWNVVEVCEGKFLRYERYHFYLSHYPCLTSNNDVDKPLKARTISLCGHSHTNDKFQDMDKGLIYHCELDAHDNKLILIDDIIEDIKNYKGE
jgi:calcineurin-like phosphoesterase family protein